MNSGFLKSIPIPKYTHSQVYPYPKVFPFILPSIHVPSRAVLKPAKAITNELMPYKNITLRNPSVAPGMCQKVPKSA